MTGVAAAPSIVPIHTLDVVVEELDWAWARDNAERIAAHWAGLVERKPALFNGKVLMALRPELEGGVYRTTYFPVDFASFISWRDFGWPDRSVINGFALAALRSSDGAYVAGVMAGHTASAGSIYFAAGTPDLDDVLPDGRLDLAGNTTRELREETGIEASDIVFAPTWQAVLDGSRIALMREAVSPLSAEALSARIDAFIAADRNAELSGSCVIRSNADIDDSRMPSFMVTYLRAVLGAG